MPHYFETKINIGPWLKCNSLNLPMGLKIRDLGHILNISDIQTFHLSEMIF